MCFLPEKVQAPALNKQCSPWALVYDKKGGPTRCFFTTSFNIKVHKSTLISNHDKRDPQYLLHANTVTRIYVCFCPLLTSKFKAQGSVKTQGQGQGQGESQWKHRSKCTRMHNFEAKKIRALALSTPGGHTGRHFTQLTTE